MKPVKDMNISKRTTIDDLNKEYLEAGGFTAKKIAVGTQILKDMKGVNIKFLSFPAAIISTGLRGLFKELAKRKMFDVFITTCGTLDHDFARCFADYHHGSFSADDKELAKQGIHRLGNIFIPFKNYGEAIEKNLQPILKEIYEQGKKDISTHELNWELGSRLNKDSILYWCEKNEIPVIVPGITDGAVGTQILMFQQENPDFKVDVFKDEQFLMDQMFGEKSIGALVVGGGISKHHVIWWSQFSGGLDYAVYVTTAVEHDGSLSGARTREAISWGKLKEKARHITIEGDATIILPLLIGPLID